MILSYLTHKKWVLTNSGIKIIATQSPIAFRNLVQAFQCQNEMLICADDSYDSLDIAKTFDFVGDPLLSDNIIKKYMSNILNSYIANINENNRNQIFVALQNLEGAIDDSLMLEDLPLIIEFDDDLKKLLKFVDLHIDSKFTKNPYAIIDLVLKIHQSCNLKSIPVMCNLTHYLERDQLIELSSLAQQMNRMVVLLEFTSPDLLVVPEGVQFYYIDQDLIDLY
ncbi:MULTISPECIES: type II-A CRISPR-associated protein Csn2 [unclassified Lactobacillus]|uniref:type II-A CRISPR-associated protein Csn2 n=1 Tax=unclassified Lactobacillus TaxID=2620435 RepID=UPI000EFCB289|nr:MULTISPECIES: type II-A CRISPR-associated protein Csn2 [unclassified Lactobacillus]RMC25792.1 type II-A CRISPR-associated protein Csn2 [Lactobacillus sp. ESL0247]RMC29604.1 type II-A CRISPR-associated protein Csn2 [Lactobacillus sp. ESL0246]RMC33593.1 type II-A CRISPR-associated protein Csn2 [Lactobacillus sp. ESL0245]